LFELVPVLHTVQWLDCHRLQWFILYWRDSNGLRSVRAMRRQRSRLQRASRMQLGICNRSTPVVEYHRARHGRIRSYNLDGVTQLLQARGSQAPRYGRQEGRHQQHQEWVTARAGITTARSTERRRVFPPPRRMRIEYRQEQLSGRATQGRLFCFVKLMYIHIHVSFIHN
jgi:hypothetical protein